MINLNFKNTGVPHLDSKIYIEDYLKKSNLNYTIFKLPSFMENIGKKFFPIKKNYVRGLLHKNCKVTFISCKDIGEFVSMAFDVPEKFLNKEINLIADLKTGKELAEILSELLKRKIKYKSPPIIILRIFAKEFYEMKKFYEKLATPPYLKELEEIMKNCREIHPEMTKLEDYLLKQFRL